MRVTVNEDGTIQPDSDLMWHGYEVAMRIIGTKDRRVRVTREERRAVTFFLMTGMMYYGGAVPRAALQFRGKRYPDGSQDIAGKQLAAMRDYWHANLYGILLRGVGGGTD